MEAHSEELGQGEMSPENLERANINPSTGLATDYLNHFNEVVMLLEMMPDLPDCAGDVLIWQPCDYIQHFEQSNFSEKRLAIKAFDCSPTDLRDALNQTVALIDAEVLSLQALIENAEALSPEILHEIQHRATTFIRPLITQASGIIHGHIPDDAEALEDATQADVDALFS
ncbi:hypothetical protein [Pseudovibrio exalbescens]|uniref:Uncharacterized protein n=1 Tax=Pseudovibrio exalbescens TaxID=197461 RepID=A0A1U7JD09_9HYPH|nr:hypothetical protein [Pseudovibrio exalbescens]OKL42562.1 hypothetical protein A3843_18050 [Pseudovibrio exalbescens]